MSDNSIEETAVGDGRLKHVTVTTHDGERIEYDETYLKHADSAFIVSSDAEFPVGETTRYAKAALLRIEITQHHSACFITTAVAGDEATLSTLRGFRDETLAHTLLGRALIGVYEAVSPPIAGTLSRHPDAHMTRFVRWLVVQCAGLARRRTESDVPGIRTAYLILLLVLYVFGVTCAIYFHLFIRCSKTIETKLLRRNSEGPIRGRKSVVRSRWD